MKNLEIYIHIPFCVKKCAYCDFLSAPASTEAQRQYLLALLREIRELPGKLILEIEKPDDAKTQRRLRFYEREGLTLAPFGYDAPGYQAGTGDCALQLMSEGAMSKLEFARHCAFLQEVVLDCTAGGAKPLCIWKE